MFIKKNIFYSYYYNICQSTCKHKIDISHIKHDYKLSVYGKQEGHEGPGRSPEMMYTQLDFSKLDLFYNLT